MFRLGSAPVTLYSAQNSREGEQEFWEEPFGIVLPYEERITAARQDDRELTEAAGSYYEIRSVFPVTREARAACQLSLRPAICGREVDRACSGRCI
jgi:hypothetical protein